VRNQVPSGLIADEADVIVVGAGPGGSAAAYHMARHGLRVVLLEKTEFPREKVCGDGLTPRAADLLARELGLLQQQNSEPVPCHVIGRR